MENTTLLWDELIQKAKEGDQEAFGEIFEFFIIPLYRFLFFRIGDEQNAEKLTEEVFLKIWKNIKKFRPHGKITFSVWIFQTAHLVASHFLERVKKMGDARKKFLEARENAVFTPEQREQRILATAFADLPSTQSEALIFKYFCDLSTTEIGLILEKTEGAVRILQSRGLKRLREVLGE